MLKKFHTGIVLKEMNTRLKCECLHTRDIDLHRYECISCGKVHYYNLQARIYYENGGKPAIDNWNYLNNENIRNNGNNIR